jgi:hypothetical protein
MPDCNFFKTLCENIEINYHLGGDEMSPHPPQHAIGHRAEVGIGGED